MLNFVSCLCVREPWLEAPCVVTGGFFYKNLRLFNKLVSLQYEKPAYNNWNCVVINVLHDPEKNG